MDVSLLKNAIVSGVNLIRGKFGAHNKPRAWNASLTGRCYKNSAGHVVFQVVESNGQKRWLNSSTFTGEVLTESGALLNSKPDNNVLAAFVPAS